MFVSDLRADTDTDGQVKRNFIRDVDKGSEGWLGAGRWLNGGEKLGEDRGVVVVE